MHARAQWLSVITLLLHYYNRARCVWYYGHSHCQLVVLLCELQEVQLYSQVIWGIWVVKERLQGLQRCIWLVVMQARFARIPARCLCASRSSQLATDVFCMSLTGLQMLLRQRYTCCRQLSP
eukprot:scaffold139747_cov18-Tisochrysis_lutea.AAC.2